MPKKHDLQSTYYVPAMTTEVSVKETDCAEPDLDTIEPWLFPAHKTVGQNVNCIGSVHTIRCQDNYRPA